ncbi:MAG: hypothetical protein K2N78_03565 [Oscillospiraceae bacterium]|nr:hypothetical protein [Oscillospiraceae bacterium]
MAFAMRVKKYLLSFLILVLGGYLLLVLAYCLPTEKISENVAESALAFYNEGPYRQLNFGGGSSGNSTQDNFTDAIILLNAENANNENVFIAALKVNRITSGDQLPTDTLIAFHTGTDQEYGTSSYARYWHGYLVFLKPLLLIFSYQQIRYILALVQLGLVAAVIGLLAARGKGLYCIPVVLTYFFLNPAVCSLSLQYTPVLVLTMAELIVILLREKQYAEDKRLWLYHFFLAGCLTSYFDFLTYPVVTLGIPVIFLVSQYEESWKEGLKELFGACLLWGTGYVGMWAGKWMLGSLITGENVLGEAINSISYRTGSEAAELGISEIGRLDAIRLNLAANKFSLILILIAFAVCVVLSECRGTSRFQGKYIPTAFAGLMPFAWYLVVSNHSIVHSWMTFRTLAVFVYALMSVGVMLLEKPQPVLEGQKQVKRRK